MDQHTVSAGLKEFSSRFSSPYELLFSIELDLQTKIRLLTKWNKIRLSYLYMNFHERCWERDQILAELDLCLDFLNGRATLLAPLSQPSGIGR